MTSLSRLVRALLSAALVVGVLAVPTTAQAAAAPFGPDVSRWQHPNGAKIDWAKVKAGGSSFTLIKATEGGTYTNPYYATDAADARANGLAVGAYHYARPALPFTSASDQAAYFASVIGDVQTPATLPPVLDLETTGGLSSGQLVLWAQIFTETLRAQTGRTPVIYTYPSFWNVQMGGTSAFLRSPLWLATYRPDPPVPVGGWPAWSIWQYTASARIPGVIGDVDLNRFAGDAAAFAAFADGTVPADWPVVAPAAPVSVKATAGVRSASVRWVPADDGGALPTSYTVTANPGGATVTRPSTSTTADFTGLAEGTAYAFTVSATNVAGSSPTSSASAPVTARGDVPAAPTALTARVGKGSVALSWPATSVTSYSVRRCSPAPCTPTSPVTTATGTSYVDTAVTGGVTYAYAVAAQNRWGASPAGPVTAAMPLPVVDRLETPSGVVATGAATTLQVAWRPVAFAARYHVLRCAGAGCVPAGAPVATVDTPTATLSQRVAAGSTWTYAVKAVAGPVASALSRPATATALIAQAIRVTASPAVPKMGQSTTLTVRLTRPDSRAPLVGRPLTLSFAPARGAAPRPLTVRTSAAGTASVVVRPSVNQVVAVRSAAKDVTTLVSRTTLKVKPVVGATLSATTAAAGATVTLSGRTNPLFNGERVFRQAWVSGRWRLVASAPVSRTGDYRFTVLAPAKPGTIVLRVFFGRTRLHDSGASGSVRLTAR